MESIGRSHGETRADDTAATHDNGVERPCLISLLVVQFVTLSASVHTTPPNSLSRTGRAFSKFVVWKMIFFILP